jgi:arachidonate 5-lipoxygenase
MKLFHVLIFIFRWKDDKLFGMQRLMGVNPDVIHLCTKIPSKLPVNNEMLKPFLEMSLEDALTKKRIFIIDYEIMDGLPIKSGFTMTSPIALFYQQNDGTLIPIAVQLFQKPGVDNPVFLLSDQRRRCQLSRIRHTSRIYSFEDGRSRCDNTQANVQNTSDL